MENTEKPNVTHKIQGNQMIHSLGSLHWKAKETSSSGCHFGRVSHRNNHRKRSLQNCSYDSPVPEVCWLTGGFPAALGLLWSPDSKLGRSISVRRHEVAWRVNMCRQQPLKNQPQS